MSSEDQTVEPHKYSLVEPIPFRTLSPSQPDRFLTMIQGVKKKSFQQIKRCTVQCIYEGKKTAGTRSNSGNRPPPKKNKIGSYGALASIQYGVGGRGIPQNKLVCESSLPAEW